MAKLKKSPATIKIRCSEKEKWTYQGRAETFFDGNMSSFIRHCCNQFRPEKMMKIKRAKES